MKSKASVIFVILMALCFSSIQAKAQDIIFLRSGDEINALVVKIGSESIEYKKYSNVNGPTYELAKKEVFMIKYQNGEKDLFKEEAHPNNNAQEKVSAEPCLVEIPTDSRNEEIIKQYASNVDAIDFSGLKMKNSNSSMVIILWKMNPLSKLSNSEIEVQIVPAKTQLGYLMPVRGGDELKGADGYTLAQNSCGWYYISLINKSGKTLYVDKALCTRTNAEGVSTRYYNKQVHTVSQGTNSASVAHLGGVLSPIGGANATSSGTVTSTEYSDEQIIAIPPYGSVCLQTDNIVTHMDDFYHNKFSARNFGGHEDFVVSARKENLKLNEIGEYTAENSPYNYKIIIAYSSTADFSKYSILEARLYASNVLGAPFLNRMERDKKGYFIREVVWGSKLISFPENIDWNHFIISAGQ